MPESSYFPCPHCGRQYRKLAIDYSSFTCNQCGKQLGSKAPRITPDQDSAMTVTGFGNTVDDGPRSMATHAPLGAAATPELYRVNAFRITGLPVHAAARDISKQLERMKIAEKLGSSMAGRKSLLPLAPPPDLEAVRQAMQRLRDPEARLVDEFFWFWPSHLGDSVTDKALDALSAGDLDTAINTWTAERAAHDDGFVPIHNLAVLHHAVALDLESASRTRPLTEAEVSRRDASWRQAFAQWKRILHHGRLWDALAARVSELDDPRLNADSTSRFRASLRFALLNINARLAVRAAEQGNVPEATRHIRIMDESGLDQSTMDAALRKVLAPTRDRLHTVCKAAESECETQPDRAITVVKRLLEQCRPLLVVVDTLLPGNNPIRDASHDQVALAARSCLADFVKKTEGFDECLPYLQAALLAAASESVKSRIEEDVKALTPLADYQREYGYCWFCRRERPDETAATEVDMYGNVNRVHVVGGTRLEWQKLTVKVPRCAACGSAHRQAGTARISGGVVGGLIGFPSCVGIVNAGPDATGVGLFVFACAVAIGAVIGHLIGQARLTTRRFASRTEFSGVTKLLAQGWQVGQKPPEAR